MRIQATSFRLPALKLQPKDSYQCLSYGDNNLSNSSMIKYQSSPLRNYDPSPIKKRVRGMTIAIYNSQEKLKTADYRNGGEFITQIQQNNQSTSVVNTFRRYRSKLKQLMQPAKDEGVNSRDPRLFSFKDPGATIRLDRLNNDHKDQQIQDKVTQLMGRVRLLFSSKQFYQEPLHQDTFQVTLVKLKDEYDCLYQDFNDYYVQNNKLDKQVLQLLNHMEIIETLLKPKQPIKIKKYQPQQPNIIQPEQQSPIVEAQEIVEETPQQSLIVEPPQFSPQQPNQLSTHEPREPSVFTPLTSKQYNNDQSISDLENDQQNKPNIQKKKKQKNKKSPQKSQKTIVVQESILDLNALEDQNQITQQIQSQKTIKQRSTPQNNQAQIIQYDNVLDSEQNQQEDTSNQIDKPALKRTVSNLGSMSKKRNTLLENKEGQKKQKKVGTISEQDDSNQEEEKQNNTQIEGQIDSYYEQQQSKIKSQEFTFLDMLIESQNIYKYPFYQNWEFHTDEIIKGTSFGEYDL
ncbi:unnamed protein product [Paramecium pentaurelia]|uniref:Uncharacterized protein n=1 Tax=Paramecium pentaurelia TaxID=43138 RepID=A0A8S1WIE6_9CILI|nr:unnamed protein product [Paramecium pentaurelia]